MIRERLAAEEDQAAPHIIDGEVLGVIQREHQAGRLDHTAAVQAVSDLTTWPGERFGHRLLPDRAWQLRDTVRGVGRDDAMYVALAAALESVLLPTDRRLAAAAGLRCPIEIVQMPA